MSDREKKIAAIREPLEKATPVPWEYEMWEGCADVKQLRIEIRSLKKEKYQLVMQKAERDAEIAGLKEENERLQREIKRYAELEKALRERGRRNGRRKND